MIETVILSLAGVASAAVLGFPFLVGIKNPNGFDKIAEAYAKVAGVLILGLLIYRIGFSDGVHAQIASTAGKLPYVAPANLPLAAEYIIYIFAANICYAVALAVFRQFMVKTSS